MSKVNDISNRVRHWLEQQASYALDRTVNKYAGVYGAPGIGFLAYFVCEVAIHTKKPSRLTGSIDYVHGADLHFFDIADSLRETDVE